MTDFKIFTERLKDGTIQEVSEEYSADFLDVSEDELCLSHLVQVTGMAYIADKDLIMSLEAKTKATLPCRVCNKDCAIHLETPRFTLCVPLSEIGTGVFDFSKDLREAILLEIPVFAECENGNCPERGELERYLKKPVEGKNSSTETCGNAFAGL